MGTPTTPSFWHDPRIPYLEARSIEDGRDVCYGKHAHEAFSIGLITGGQSVYLNGTCQMQIREGTVVVMNPGDVHACHPIGEQAWSYRMFYVDRHWLAQIQHDAGLPTSVDFHPYSTAVSQDRSMYRALESFYLLCSDPNVEPFAKESAALSLFASIHDALLPLRLAPRAPHPALQRAAELIREQCTATLKLDDICKEVNLSPSHFVRAFKARYGLTPHAYLVNCRIEYCRRLLRCGVHIADAALQAGFADQVHLQRTFKQHVAATPGQYRSRQLLPSVRT